MNAKHTLDHATAAGIVRAGHAKATGIGAAVCVAVVDDGGHPVALGRMDGAPFVSAPVSLNKANTASGQRRLHQDACGGGLGRPRAAGGPRRPAGRGRLRRGRAAHRRRAGCRRGRCRQRGQPAGRRDSGGGERGARRSAYHDMTALRHLQCRVDHHLLRVFGLPVVEERIVGTVAGGYSLASFSAGVAECGGKIDVVMRATPLSLLPPRQPPTTGTRASRLPEPGRQGQLRLEATVRGHRVGGDLSHGLGLRRGHRARHRRRRPISVTLTKGGCV